MALTFAKKAAAAPKQAEKTEDTSEKQASTKTAAATGGSSGSVASWMKKGSAAKAAIDAEDAKAELAKQEKDKLWRFWMPPEEERKITFLDGDVDADGMLDVPMFYEHSVKINGDRENFVCTAEQEGACPICDAGDSKPYLVGVLTILDHTPYKIKKGDNAGKILKNTRKLFVAKKQTIKQLSKIAAKRDGLTGCTFDVTRGDDRTAAVGNQFDFVEKQSLKEVGAKYELEGEACQPADYKKEITYRTGAELIELGAGKAVTGPGTEKGVVDKKSLKDEL